MEDKYKVKYAIMEIKENKKINKRTFDMTRGFIVSRCYVIDENVTDGIYKVIFPYSDFESFKSCNEIHESYKIEMVDKVYDSFMNAKVDANIKNKKIRKNLINYVSLLSFGWRENYEMLERDLDKDLIKCKEFEELIFNNTMNLPNDKDEVSLKLVRK